MIAMLILSGVRTCYVVYRFDCLQLSALVFFFWLPNELALDFEFHLFFLNHNFNRLPSFSTKQQFHFHETVMHAIDGCLDILIWRLWFICDGLFLLCILLLFAKSRMFLINFVYFPVVFLSLLVCKKLAC
jgi:hypothetical protein